MAKKANSNVVGSKERVSMCLPVDLLQRARAVVYWSPGKTLSGVVADGLASEVGKLEKKTGSKGLPSGAQLPRGRRMV